MMKSKASPDESYFLSYRCNNIEENLRLNSQHEVIKHAMLNGQLIHPSISITSSWKAIADLGCGTGVWLEDIQRTYFGGTRTDDQSPMTLVGFDVNTNAFDKNPPPGIQLIEHDCTKTFDSIYTGTFDLVNIRGLAYALSAEGFRSMVENAVQLLSNKSCLNTQEQKDSLHIEPGGYLQWLETETRLFKSYPETTEILKALTIIIAERQQRELAPYLPHFMLEAILSFTPKPIPLGVTVDSLTILSFELLPGGYSRPSKDDDKVMNDRFSDIVMESVELLLHSCNIRTRSKLTTNLCQDESLATELVEIEKLMSFIKDARQANTIRMGGQFPRLIARKDTGAV